MRKIFLCFAFLLACLSSLSIVATAVAQSIPGDMISPKFDSAQCLTVDGAVNAAPAIKLQACRGTNSQSWVRDTGASKWRTALDNNYCLATVDSTPYAAAPLTVRLCTDSRALTLEPNPTLADSYRIAGTAFVLDTGVYGYVAIAHQNGWSYQYWRWFRMIWRRSTRKAAPLPTPSRPQIQQPTTANWPVIGSAKYSRPMLYRRRLCARPCSPAPWPPGCRQ